MRAPALIAVVSLLGVSLATAQPATGMKAEKEKLLKMEKAYKSAKAAYLKSPKNPKLKAAYVDATVKFGTGTMLSPTLGPKDKYPKALKLYREALKIDPKNKEALQNKKMIEDIYRQMNRPIPA